jgi:hypothetical protein
VRYREAVHAGLKTLAFEIDGSPHFHRLHWEALQDPKLPQPLLLQATMVRRNRVLQLLFTCPCCVAHCGAVLLPNQLAVECHGL